MAYKLALVQVEVHDGETPDERLKRVVGMIENIEDASLVMLPELWVTSFFADNFAEVAQELNGSIVQTLSSVAKKKQLWLHGGSIVERGGDGNIYNTSLFFNPKGELVETYRKMHLFGYKSQESYTMTNGMVPTVINTPFGHFGFSTCYDVRFPELYRTQLELGAEVFLLTAAWPYLRLEHWQTLTQARAIENLSYVVACNSVGLSYGTQQLGHSVVYDPWGVPIASAGDEETILYATIDLDYLHRIRDTFPALRDRILKEDKHETLGHHSPRRDPVHSGR